MLPDAKSCPIGQNISRALTRFLLTASRRNAILTAMTKLIDITGQRFGKWAVLRAVAPVASGSRWECRCDCGVVRVVRVDGLRSGRSRSCGCSRPKPAPRPRRKNLGLSTTCEYRTWFDMRRRCRNPRHPDYPHYGGRGITVCDRWNEFENFRADMGQKPSPELTLDRIDNDGNYEPGNCRWATWKEQVANRRRNVTRQPTCKRGHPWTAESEMKNGSGRTCRTCRNNRYAARALPEGDAR